MSSSFEEQHVPERTLKILLLGDSGVGKSCLLLRYTDDSFVPEHQSTIGVDYKFKVLPADRHGAIKLMLWDTAGQERFRTLTSSYYRGAHGVVLVYDVGRRASFEDVEAVWLKELEAYIQLDRDREVSVEEGRELAKKLGALFMECSAKTKKGVKEAFEELVSKAVNTPGILSPQAPDRTQPLVDNVSNSSYCSC